MNVIGVDSSGENGGVSLLIDGKVTSYIPSDGGRSFSRSIIPFINRCVSDAKVELKDIDLFSVALGPGSFTGIRIGIATLLGLTMTTQTPLIGVSSLEAMAEAARLAGKIADGTKVVTLIDAGRQNIYHGGFEVADGAIKRVSDDGMHRIDDIIKVAGSGCYLGNNICWEDGSLDETVQTSGAGKLINMSNLFTATAVASIGTIKHNSNQKVNLKPNYIHKGPAVRG